MERGLDSSPDCALVDCVSIYVFWMNVKDTSCGLLYVFVGTEFLVVITRQKYSVTFPTSKKFAFVFYKFLFGDITTTK